MDTTILSTITDDSTPSELIYNEYLKAFFMQQYTKNKINQHTASCEKQLQTADTLLMTKEKELRELESKIREKNNERDFQVFLQELKENVKKSVESLKETKMEEFLDAVIEITKGACTKTYLHNVKAFENQEAYDEFESSFIKFVDSQVKIKETIGRPENIKSLNDQLSECKNVMSELQTGEETIKSFEKVLGLELLRKISDLFNDRRVNDKDSP